WVFVAALLNPPYQTTEVIHVALEPRLVDRLAGGCRRRPARGVCRPPGSEAAGPGLREGPAGRGRGVRGRSEVRPRTDPGAAQAIRRGHDQRRARAARSVFELF